MANRDNQFSLGNVIYGSDMGSSGLIDGKVGIGTMNPAYKLDVNGVGSFTSVRITAGAASGRILTSDPSGNAHWDAGIYSAITAAGNIVG